VLTLERLRELPLLEADVRDELYVGMGIAVNHGSHDPAALNKAIRRRTTTPSERPTKGLLATPPSAEPLDLSDL
jgi:hypothetical protein